MRTLEIGTDKTTTAMMEIILRLKIRDAMSKELKTAHAKDSLRIIQNLMKKSSVSGILIVGGKEDNTLSGMVSVDHIMNALDGGYIEESAEKHMATSLVVLEDDMPLSIAISYFNKYSYHRFPVINRKKKLVGILTSRDVLVALLKELSTEIDLIENRTENRLAAERATTLNAAIKEFHVKKHDFEKAGQASFKLKKMLKDRNVPQKLIRRASVSAYELEINLVIHSIGGRISFLVDDWRIIIISRDEGPGIADVSLVLQEGYSTADEWIRSLGFGAGMGLANTRRVSDEFDIQSEPGKGTTVTSIIYLESGNETFSADEKA